MEFGAADRARLEARGISLEEARRQLALIAQGLRTRVERPCVIGDGVLHVEATPERLQAQAEAAAAGRFSRFVPASGAATRMFKDLLRARAEGLDEAALRASPEAWAQAAVSFLDARDRLAFRGTNLATILDRYAASPKGLLPFHGERTPFFEQLAEAEAYATDDEGGCRLHFTVSPEHRASFEALADQANPRFEITFSTQDPATDTIAATPEGALFRDEAGQIVLRPGGHGALIGNLGRLGGDLIYVKNIDNVQPAAQRADTLLAKRITGGLAVQLQTRIHALLRNLEAQLPAALAFLAEHFDARPTGDALAWARDRLDRPLRVCGVVRNTGEPGGGPFWVQGTRQIVEKAQLDLEDADQRAAFESATHFNPVDLCCAVRGPEGRPYALADYVDPETAMVSEKSAGGRDLLALERPGLWNGAMAGWNTVFVEVPLSTFTPVKTVLDLLRPEHQP